jgi:hypothetical protein
VPRPDPVPWPAAPAHRGHPGQRRRPGQREVVPQLVPQPLDLPGSFQTSVLWVRTDSRQHVRVALVFSELGNDHEKSCAGWGLAGPVTVRPAASVKAGMPRLMVVARRAVIWSTWASLSRAPARLIFRPSASPSQRGGFGFGYPVGEVAADLGQAGTLGGVGSQQRATGRARGCRGCRRSGRSLRGRPGGARSGR